MKFGLWNFTSFGISLCITHLDFFFLNDRKELLPLADIVTPNLREASALLGGIPLETVSDMRSAAKSIHDIGPRFALEKLISVANVNIVFM